MSEIVKWLLIAFIALNALATVSEVGKPRRPMTSGVAIAVIVINVAMVIGILAYWGGGS